jgi:hypothetical protein
MRLDRTAWPRTILYVLSAALVLLLAAWLRAGGFTAPHMRPVELAYVSLAMKMGAHDGLSEYHLSGVQILKKAVPQMNPSSPPIPIASPTAVPYERPASFAGWPPEDSNPFYLKSPLFPALLAYSHHQALSPGFVYYPVSAALHTGTKPPEITKALLQTQGWAIIIPFISGLALVLITLALGWRMFGPAVGILAGGILAIYPAQIVISTRILPEAMLSVLILIAFWLCRHFASTANPTGCLLAGGVWALAALTDTAAFFTLPAFIVWTIWMDKKFKCRYLAAFGVGFIYVYKVWPDYVKRVFHTSAFMPVDLTSAVSAGWGSGGWPAPIEGLVLWVLPIAAAASTVHFFIKKQKRDEAHQAETVVVLCMMILSVIASRLIYAHSAPWDAQAAATIIPFAALLAAQWAQPK